MSIILVSGLAATALGGPTLTLEGGGFRAQSAATGFVAGMLTYVGRQQVPPNPTPTLESTELLGRFAAFASNSGSSWFFSELTYSAPFKHLVEQMAAAPNASAAAYHAAWTRKWLEATDVHPLKFNLFADAARALVSALFGTGDEDTVYLLQFFLATGHTSWDDFIDVLLNSTSGVLPTARLGGPLSGAWADGKVWLVDHNIVTPTHGSPDPPGSSHPPGSSDLISSELSLVNPSLVNLSLGSSDLLGSSSEGRGLGELGSAGHQARLYQAKSVYPQASYLARASRAMPLPLYTPAAYSVTLGAGLESEAPFRYVAPSAVAGLRGLDYVGVTVPLLDVHRSSWEATTTSDVINSSSSGDGNSTTESSWGVGGPFNNRKAGMLPVSRVAAASSAFLGGACVAGWVAAEATALVGLDLVPWASNAPGGRSFSAANALVAQLRHDTGQQAIDALAAAAVHGVIDGAYTEGTGVATAVAAGATELVVLLNSIRNTSDAGALSASFLRLFRGGPPPPTQPEATNLTQVFEAPLAPAVLQRLQAFRRLSVPAGSLYLSEVALGSFWARTAANPHYGIPSRTCAAGRRVRVHVVSIGSSLNLGEFENLAHYDLLAQEIALAINAPTNAALVGTALLPMFLPVTLPATGTAAAAGDAAAAGEAAAALEVAAVVVQEESGPAAGAGAEGPLGVTSAVFFSLAAAGLAFGAIVALVRRRRAHRHLHLRVSLVEGTLTADQEDGMLGLRGSSAPGPRGGSVPGRQFKGPRPVACWGSHDSSSSPQGAGAEAAPAGRDGDYRLS